MVGCDEGKARALDRCGGRQGGRVPGREAPPPAGHAIREPRRRDRSRATGALALPMWAGTARGRGLDGAPSTTARAQRSNLPCPCRSRSRHSWASSWRRKAVSRAQIRAHRIKCRISLTFGTNRELSGFGLTERSKGATRPPVTAGCPMRQTSSRRREGSLLQPRRRDARPVRSGGRRDGEGQRTAGPRAIAGRTAGCIRPARRSRRRARQFSCRGPSFLVDHADVMKIGAQLADRHLAGAQPVHGYGQVGRPRVSSAFQRADSALRAEA